MNTNAIFKKLTLNDKIDLVTGNGFVFGKVLEKYGVRPLRTSDGPHGLRLSDQIGKDGKVLPTPATAFPCAVTIASGWNEDNAFKIGEAIGEECRYYSVDVLLGPGANIKRNPLCGRNFEYFSEDPLLSGEMAGAEINGLKKNNVGACLKHFALNNTENYRSMVNSAADERTIREIYVRSFERAIKKGQPDFVMSAYNKVNGEHCSKNHYLLTEILRDKLRFDGVVMSDWGGVTDRVNALLSGLDLEMPGNTSHTKKSLLIACEKDEEVKNSLDKAVKRILLKFEKYTDNQPIDCDFEKHDALCSAVSEDCAVLMKNDGTLPIDKDKRHLIVGEFFENTRFQGAGSSMITPKKLTTVKQAFDDFCVNYEYFDNTDEISRKASDFDDAIIFIGLPDIYESECKDRENAELPERQLNLIDKVIKLGLKTAVVFYGGSPVELPFLNDINAFLNMYLPGQSCGLSTYRLLFGLTNPSGKLAETWVKSYADVPLGNQFGKFFNEKYKEGILVGYPYYYQADIPVAFPFGFGLSYTSFEYGDLSVTEKENGYDVSFSLKNTGNCYGGEIAQIYISPTSLPSYFPPIRLVGFKKVYLNSGEKKQVNIFIPFERFSVFSTKDGDFRIFDGKYIISVNSDSNVKKLSSFVEISKNYTYNDENLPFYCEATRIRSISDEDFSLLSGVKLQAEPPILPLTIESPIFHFKHTFFGRIIYNIIISDVNRQIKRAEKIQDEIKRESLVKGAWFIKFSIERGSMRVATMMNNKKIPHRVAEGIVDIANGKLFKGLFKIIFKA